MKAPAAFPELSTRWVAGAGAAVAALLVTALVALFSVGGAPSGASLAGYPEHAHGLQLQYLARLGFDAVVRDPADPRVLYVMVPHDGARGACSVIQPAARVLAQSERSVTIALSGYEYLPGPDHGLAFTCYLGNRIGIPVRLAAPLGNRVVAGGDHLLGSGPAGAATVLDPRDFPRPQWLPRGYRTSTAQPIDGPAGRIVAHRSFLRRDARLVVASGPAGALDVAVTDPGTRTTVAGHAARIVTGAEQRCVVWDSGGGRARAVCSFASTPLPAGELLRIARSLR